MNAFKNFCHRFLRERFPQRRHQSSTDVVVETVDEFVYAGFWNGQDKCFVFLLLESAMKFLREELGEAAFRLILEFLVHFRKVASSRGDTRCPVVCIFRGMIDTDLSDFG